MGNIIVNTAGGTAGKGAKSYKLALPSSWINQMGLSESAKGVELRFDGQSITICRRRTLEETAAEWLAAGHTVLRLRYYNADMLCSTILADCTDKTVRADNTTVQTVKTAFGRNEFPSWSNFEAFLEERCVPKARSGLREYLEAIGVEEYDPMAIIQKTGGRMAEDDQWLSVEVLK